jgi:hypothetical protein
LQYDSASMIDHKDVKRHSPRTLGFSAVSWACIGGIWLGHGIEQLIHRRSEYDWTTSLLLGSAFLLYGIYWVVMLIRHATTSRTATSAQ